jgi:hypothetical protein
VFHDSDAAHNRKNPPGGMRRVYFIDSLRLYRNFFHEKKDRKTPAMRLGIADFTDRGI